MGLWNVFSRLFGGGKTVSMSTSPHSSGSIPIPIKRITVPPPTHPILQKSPSCSNAVAKPNASFEIVGSLAYWLPRCFRKPESLTSDEKRKLQTAVDNARMETRFPRSGYELTDDQRIEIMIAAKDALGEERFLKLGVIDITRLAPRLSIQKKVREPKPISVECSGCGQKYDAHQELANTLIECDKCKAFTQIPRPKSGYYSAVTDQQMDDALHLGAVLSKEMHNGEASNILAKAREAFKQLPQKEQDRRYKIKAEKDAARMLKEMSDLRETISNTESSLKGKNLSVDQKRILRDELKELKEELAEKLEDEREDRRCDKESEARDKEWERTIRQHYVSEFSSGGDWYDLYRKPSKAQFDEIFQWLVENEVEISCSSISNAIDRLFPTLKR